MAGQGAAIVVVFFVIAFITVLGLQWYENYSEERALGAFKSYVHEARQLTDANRPPPPTADAPLPKGYSIRLSGPYAELWKDGQRIVRDLYTRRVVWSDFEDGSSGWYCLWWRGCYWQRGEGYADAGYLYLKSRGWGWAYTIKSFSIYKNSTVRKASLFFAWQPVVQSYVPYGTSYIYWRAYIISQGRWYYFDGGYYICRRTWWGTRCWGSRPDGEWHEVVKDITPYISENMQVRFYERAYPSWWGSLSVDNVAVTVDFGRR
jgi:hypothetical protein